MIRDIPGVGTLELEHLVLDFNGTIANRGKLVDGVREKLEELSGQLEIWVLTADTFGTVAEELKGLPVRQQVIGRNDQGEQKMAFLESLEGGICALGNGANDVEMLAYADLGIGVMEGEGVFAPIFAEVAVMCRSAVEALDMLLDETALAATLRR